MRSIALLVAVIAIASASVYRMTSFPVPGADQAFGVIVTGCSSGLGRDVVETLARNDPRAIVFAGFRNLEDSKSYVNELNLDPKVKGRVIAIQIDVAKQDQVDTAVVTVREELKKRGGVPLYAIVSNAAVGGGRNVLDKDENQQRLRNTYEVNVFGVTRVVQGFLPLMEGSPFGGRVINVGSLMGLVHTPRCYGYCSSKFALEALTASWRYDLEPRNISVSIIEPGFFKSDMCTQSFCKDPVSVCSNAVMSSLFDTRPLTRYTCASVFGIPAWAVSYFINGAPDRVVDSVFKIVDIKE